MAFLKLYLISFVIFLAVDLIWLGIIAKNFYREQIGFLMSDEIRWIPAVIFYCLYLCGLVLFAILPALKQGNLALALLYGGLFGLICYATYDLTNLATLKGWPVKVVIYDLLWGTFISGVTSILTCWIASYWKHSIYP